MEGTLVEDGGRMGDVEKTGYIISRQQELLVDARDNSGVCVRRPHPTTLRAAGKAQTWRHRSRRIDGSTCAACAL